MSTSNETLARRWFEEVWNQRRTATIDELLAPESICHSPDGPIRGIAEFKQRVHAAFLSAFPDLKVTVVGTVAEGEEVVVRWRAEGKHTGDGLGFPPSDRHVSFQGMTWIQFRDGKMIEGWDCWDQTGVIESLRAPKEAAARPPEWS